LKLLTPFAKNNSSIFCINLLRLCENGQPLAHFLLGFTSKTLWVFQRLPKISPSPPGGSPHPSEGEGFAGQAKRKGPGCTAIQVKVEKANNVGDLKF
jgi:hypothetical protein